MGAGNLMIGRELVNEDNFRVLVALDRSEASLNALQTLWSLFDPEAMEITLIHVMEMPWAGDDVIDCADLGEYREQLERELRRTADTVVRNAQEQLDRRSIACATLIKEGDPALEICSEADNGGYDLVLAGATGVSDVKHGLLGSVSLKVAWDAPCSVAIIRQAA
jgi:nucleotide-binding universal stress UspA family protein